MSIIETFRRNWFIAIFGIILYICGATVLFWNEGRAVHTILSLDEVLDNAVTLNPRDDEYDAMYNNRVIHITGPIIIGEPLTEPDYNIQVLAVKLKRRVQMFQWVEESVERNFHSNDIVDDTFDERTYYYNRVWRDDLVDSRNFYHQIGHENPRDFPIKSLTQVADAVYIGRCELGSEVKQKFTNFVPLTSDTRPEDPSIKIHLGMYYHTNNLFNPQVGDIRILFSFAGLEGEMYTIVGKLVNNRLVPYKTKRDINVLLVYPGELNLTEIFKREHYTQRLTTWGYRLIGWILIFFGVTCTSALLHIILMRTQYLAALAPDPQFPVGANLLLSLSITLIMASIAWILQRPMVGVGLIFAAASPFVWFARGITNYQSM